MSGFLNFGLLPLQPSIWSDLYTKSHAVSHRSIQQTHFYHGHCGIRTSAPQIIISQALQCYFYYKLYLSSHRCIRDRATFYGWKLLLCICLSIVLVFIDIIKCQPCVSGIAYKLEILIFTNSKERGLMKIRFRMRLTLLKSNIPGTVDNSWFANEKDNVCITQDVNTRF